MVNALRLPEGIHCNVPSSVNENILNLNEAQKRNRKIHLRKCSEFYLEF